MTEERDNSTTRKVNPNSIANLIHEGRPPAFDEEKKRRTLTVTESGWEGTMTIAKALECRGISELIELIGRGELSVTRQNTQIVLEDEQLREIT